MEMPDIQNDDPGIELIDAVSVAVSVVTLDKCDGDRWRIFLETGRLSGAPYFFGIIWGRLKETRKLILHRKASFRKNRDGH